MALSDENNPTYRTLSPRTHTVPVTQATILVNTTYHLKATLSRLGIQFQPCRHGNQIAIKRVFREIKQRTSSFSNTFSHVKTSTVE
jgi:putative transposase